ncbi:N-acetylmuramoyl-L-alanine amidase [Candidatus Peregrinibacteria bacterium]|nr:N-acetylmuramoyl-L-alanine amidase [Candidatus Peregrinibacteria bacterium]
MKKTAALMIICATLINASFADAAGVNVIKRAAWQANEDLRLFSQTNPEPELVTLPADFYLRFAAETKLKTIIEQTLKNEKLTWPLQYPEKISKIIIHHTGTSKHIDDPIKTIRDLYYYHAIKRGWGDIGYNYIIDANGNIYEGRYGGDGVVGAHAGPGNRGSIGIAVLGNYNESELSAEAEKALTNLIAEKSRLYGIDPLGESYFRGIKLPNIFGHNGIMATSCPGKNIIKLLPQIRQNAARLNRNIDYEKIKKSQIITNNLFEFAGGSEPLRLTPDKKYEFQIKLTNTGNEEWNKNTRLSVQSNALTEQAFTIYTPKLSEEKIPPGATATFNASIYTKVSPGFFYLSYKPVINGEKTADITVDIPVIVEKPVFAYEFIQLAAPKKTFKAGERITSILTLKNTGNVSWKNYGDQRITIGTENPRDRQSIFSKSNRLGYLKENIVKPGQNGHFVFSLKAPMAEGIYQEYFAPVIEKITWLDGNNMKLTFNINNQ